MGSRSKRRQPPPRQMGVAATPVDHRDSAVVFWQRVLTALAAAEQDQTLSWESRAVLVTQLPVRLINLCSIHDMGEPLMYAEAVRRVVTGKRLEWFDKDRLKKLKSVMHKIIAEYQAMRATEANAAYLLDAVRTP